MTAHTPTAGTPYDLPTAAARQLPRRSREELEALAADFVNSKLHPLPPAARKPLPKPMLAGIAGATGTVLVALLTWAFWPSGEPAPAAVTAPAGAEAGQWAQRLEAERERKRQELERSRQYLAKMAAADSALVQEMSNRAQNLAARAEHAAPRTRAEEPTPRTQAMPAEARPAPAQEPAAVPAKAKPQASQAQPATAAAQPTVVAAAPQCSIHVSELSSSGKLTYADVARMKGVRVGSDGHAFTPPLKTAEGRSVVFEVMPSGCVRVARGSR